MFPSGQNIAGVQFEMQIRHQDPESVGSTFSSCPERVLIFLGLYSRDQQAPPRYSSPYYEEGTGEGLFRSGVFPT